MQKVDTLPQGWIETTISELSELVTKGTTPTTLGFEYINQKGVLFVKVESIKDQSIDHSKCAFINDETNEALKRSQLKEEDVLISIAGTLGRIGIVRSIDLPANTNQALAIIRPTKAILPKFLAYSLSSETTKGAVNSGKRGVGLQNLNLKQISGLRTVLPPLPEQKRIAHKIETLQSKTKKAKKALETAKPLLDKLRQSILASAFRGDLTTDWRKNNPDVEPASVLLERIRIERRKKWEENELAKMKAKGKEPKNDKWKSKYKEPEPVDTTDLAKLPNGWCWASIDEISCLVQYGSSSKTNENDKNIPVLRMGNIQNGQLVYENMRYLPIDHKDFPELFLLPGDILFNRTNSAELVGKTAVFEDIETPCSFASYLIRVRLINVIPCLISCYINSPLGRKWIQSCVSQQVGQANVNGTKLKALVVPIPPIKEQIVLENKIRKLLHSLSNLNDQIKNIHDDIVLHDQAILSKAFAGNLVQQNFSDEPASVLIKRLKLISENR